MQQILPSFPLKKPSPTIGSLVPKRPNVRDGRNTEGVGRNVWSPRPQTGRGAMSLDSGDPCRTRFALQHEPRGGQGRRPRGPGAAKTGVRGIRNSVSKNILSVFGWT